MSLQESTVHRSPVPLAKQLVNLKSDVEAGHATASDVNYLRKEVTNSSIGERLEAYSLTLDVNHLEISEAEACKAVLYASSVSVGNPVMYDGKVVPSPAIGTDSPIPVTFTREYLFKELLVMSWQDDAVERLQQIYGSEEVVRHAPLELAWEGIQYRLLAETLNKSFYWPSDVDIPSEITPWLNKLPQDRSTLVTGCKRQGINLDTLIGIRLMPDRIHADGVWDLGVLVLSDGEMTSIAEEVGVFMDASQGTIWFDDGSYFKGTIISAGLSDLKRGFYGGLKRPTGVTGESVSTRGSIMDNYVHVPWQPSMNRQESDYAGLILPVRAELPRPELFIKATCGFPSYRQALNDALVSSAGRLFQRIPVKGYAGKCAIGVNDDQVQFIIRGPKLKDGIKTMAWLFNPSLPVHTGIMKVKVALVSDATLPGNLIQLNVHKSNHHWISRWYIDYAGRDCDADGFSLTNDNIILDQAVCPSKLTYFDTTQFKSETDVSAGDEETAIRTATERIRLYAGKIGTFDKLARRIIRQNPDFMTWDVRVILTEALQRSISAQKKNSGANKFDTGYGWLLDMLPEGADKWLFGNIHDTIDDVGDHVSEFLQWQMTNRDIDPNNEPVYQQMGDTISQVSEVMADHYQAASEILELVQTIPKDSYHKTKEHARRMWAKYQARSTDVQISEVLKFIDESKHLWRSTYKDSGKESVVGYRTAVRVIRSRALSLSMRVSSELLISAIVDRLSLNLAGQILDVDDLVHHGFAGQGIHLPAATSRELKPGMIGTKGVFASVLTHPMYLDALKEGRRYRITEVQSFTGISWNPRTTRRGAKQSTTMITVKEVI